MERDSKTVILFKQTNRIKTTKLTALAVRFLVLCRSEQNSWYLRAKEIGQSRFTQAYLEAILPKGQVRTSFPAIDGNRLVVVPDN